MTKSLESHDTTTSPSSALDLSKITTLIFDVDDTLYDVGTGFTAHRNGEGATSFMVAKLNFPDQPTAQIVRDKYFEKYHSTAKALVVAEEEGQLPMQKEQGQQENGEKKKIFNPKDLSKWWTEKLNFSLLGGPNPNLVSMLESCPLNLVAFSNGPRSYVLKVLKEIGLDKAFPPEKVFAVDDVLPSCKPEKVAFEKVMNAVGVKDASECMMIEDSMKNIRVAKGLGMGTLLIAGIGRLKRGGGEVDDDGMDNAETQAKADEAEATKPGDAPDVTDDAVDFSIESVDEMKSALPALWG